MHQFFVEKSQVGKEYVTITGSDVNHIRNVLRMKIGETIRSVTGKVAIIFVRLQKPEKISCRQT